LGYEYAASVTPIPTGAAREPRMAERILSEKHVFTSVVVGKETTFTRADLELYRINVFRPSYVALVFFNDADVDEDNASADRASYVGSFALFGHENASATKAIASRPRRSVVSTTDRHIHLLEHSDVLLLPVVFARRLRLVRT